MGANLTLMKNKPAGSDSDYIDPTAVIHPGARLADGCRVGAYAVIGDGVALGRDCVVHPHGVLSGPLTMGDANEVYPFACIGGAPQDLRHRGEPTELVVGNRNVFREHVTVGRGTVHGGGRTEIGDDNLVMAYCHIAHDCVLENRVVLANGATLAGHVQVQSYSVFGGMVAVASFVRIGESAMLAAGSMVEKDVPPFSMVAGNRAVLKGVNRVGISRREFSSAACREIRQIVQQLKQRSVPLSQLMTTFHSAGIRTEEARRLVKFLDSRSRGIIR